MHKNTNQAAKSGLSHAQRLLMIGDTIQHVRHQVLSCPSQVYRSLPLLEIKPNDWPEKTSILVTNETPQMVWMQKRVERAIVADSSFPLAY